MRAAFYTLGCKVNQYESFAMMEQFRGHGFEIVEPEQPADVYVVNSCTVTATGDRKSRQVLRRLRRQSPHALLVLCGCFPQAYPDQAAQITEADLVMGAKDRAALLHAVLERLQTGAQERTVRIPAHRHGEPFEPMHIAAAGDRTRAFVKIQDGCARRCAYCIIPQARGPVRSKPLAGMDAELRRLAASGHREAVLVGINLSCYGQDIGSELADAVELACAVQGIERVRLGSLEPELLGPDTVARLAKLPKLCPQFHLSLQSGCDATLRRMRRPYTAAEYRGIAENLRAAFPGCALTTDVMVGFPGETAEEYAASEAFVRDIGFARTHVFVYSPRPGTPAADMAGQVPGPEAQARARRMAAATAESMAAFLAAQVGTTASVLFEQQAAPGVWEGYSANYTQVRVRSQADLSGQILPVRLTAAHPDHCEGELVESHPATPRMEPIPPEQR